MKYIIAIGFFLLSGCASTTSVVYEGPDGRKISYTSQKEQTNLEVELHQDAQGNIKGLTIKVDKASSDVEAMKNQGRLIDLLGMFVKSGGKP